MTSFETIPVSRAHSTGRPTTRTTSVPTSPMQAAVLAHGIAEGQSFLDGNKRLALVAMLTFLEVNGFSVPVPDR